ncbi:MAG: polyphosphate kinase 1 [Prochlorothrix sp.]
MARTKMPSAPQINLDDPRYYFNRELSWLEFNRRVLHEALDDRTRLLDRLKFLGIFSNNLDEFFMVRVAGLKQQVAANVDKRTPDGRDPQTQLNDIRSQLAPMVAEQHRHFNQVLRPALTEQGIHLLDYDNLIPELKRYLENYFEQHIFPVLTPLAVDPSHPFPHISNLSLNLAVVVRDDRGDDNPEQFARIKIPAMLPRFVKLPPDLWPKISPDTVHWAGVPLEQVVAHNLGALFPGMTIVGWYPFRVTRHANLALEEEEADDLLLAIEQELQKQRMGGSVIRLEVSSRVDESVRSRLMREMDLAEADIYTLEGPLGLHDLMSFLSLPLSDLKEQPWTPKVPYRLKGIDTLNSAQSTQDHSSSFLDQVRRGEFLVHHPYHDFKATVQRFITEAAHDDRVLAIKMTLYRTSGDSPIINALIEAAQNGKQVVVLVELKARFDEENNINWARHLEQSGVHVVYGLTGLKTHTKTTLVVRQEKDGIRRYVHIGTGNYNPKTAGLYTDLGLFSCREDLGADLTDLFNFLTGYSRQQSYRSLLVAPVNMRARMLEMIEREIKQAETGRKAQIIAKMNSLVDPEIIHNLYCASQAGVQVDLIIRGTCCLRPGVSGVSENIRVMSIIGRFLEHSRIFKFHNGGKDEIYIGSADWMPRNLNRRVEAVVQIEQPELKQDLRDLLQLMLNDNRQAWDLQADGSYRQRQPSDIDQERSSQVILMQHSGRSTPLPPQYLTPNLDPTPSDSPDLPTNPKGTAKSTSKVKATAKATTKETPKTAPQSS